MLKKWESYRFAKYGIMLRVDFFAEGIHLLLAKLGKVEEVPCLELVVPHLAYTRLVNKQGVLALRNAFVFVVLNLPEEG